MLLLQSRERVQSATIFALYILSLLWLGLASQAAPPPQRLALLIGISDYRDRDIKPLAGCENDVLALRELLVTKYRFASANVRVLLSQQASRASILRALDELARRTRAGDEVVLHFSGYSSQLPDENGDEQDRLDETLIAYDTDLRRPQTQLRDDEIGVRLLRMKQCHVTVIFDSGFAMQTSRTLQLSYGQRKTKSLTISAETAARKQDENIASTVDAPLECLVLSAARSGERVEDGIFSVGGKNVAAGVFTNSLIKVLKRASVNLTYAQAIEQAASEIKAQGFLQEPELIGIRSSNPLFGGTQASTSRSLPGVRVVAVRGKQVTLSAGAAYGITTGSIYGIIAADGKTIGAQIKIVEVSATQTRAETLSGRVAIGDMAVELVYVIGGDNRLLVRVLDQEGKFNEELATALRLLPYVSIVTPDQSYADIALVRDGQTYMLFSADGAVLIRAVSAESAAEAVKKLRADLDNSVGIKTLASLDRANPGLDFTLAVDHAKAHYRMGEKLMISFRAAQDCYLTLINIGTDGSTNILFPNAYQRDNLIQANIDYMIPSAQMGFTLPVSGPPGRDLIKAIVTTWPIDFGNLKPLADEPFRSFEPAHTPELCRRLVQTLVEELQNPSSIKGSPEQMSLPVLARDLAIAAPATQRREWATASVILTVEPTD
ncbi:MAG: caspase family protein [Acidobacteriota bacterium]